MAATPVGFPKADCYMVVISQLVKRQVLKANTPELNVMINFYFISHQDELR